MNEQIINFIKNQWNIHFKAELGTSPKGLSYVQISQSHSKNYEKSRIILLIFGTNSDKPIMIAKFTKDKSYEDSLKTEHINAVNLNKHLTKNVFPHVYAEGYINNRLVVFEEYIDGKNLDSMLSGKSLTSEEKAIGITEEIFLIAKNLLSYLNASREVSKKIEVEGELEAMTEKLRKSVKLDEKKIERLHNAVRLISKSQNKIYKGIINFDFVPSNIFKTDSSTRIIDFEFSSESSLSFMEPVRFLYYYIELLTRAGVFGSRDFAINVGIVSFDPKNWLHRLIKKHFGLIIDTHLLSEYFLVEMMHDFLMQMEVDYDAKERIAVIDQMFEALTNFVEYVYRQIKEKDMSIKFLENSLETQRHQQNIEKRELEDLRARILDITSSRMWRVMSKIRNIKRKIFR